MLRTIAATAIIACLTTPVLAQEPICVIDGARHPAADCSLVSRGGVLTPDRIDRVDVIKGEAAGVLYGRDGTNGVISITTKNGAGGGGGGPEQRGAADDPLAQYFFPPELVMAHQREIDLGDRQRAAIQDAIKDAQSRFVDLQFRMSAEVESLQRLLGASSVDEAKVLDQLDRVLNCERDVKHAQLALMIRVKNQLTEQQQSMLSQLRHTKGLVRLF
jgi:Spy/CpxP family protein refolding chaperone